MKKSYIPLAVGLVFLLNIALRMIYVFYAYIPAEEGFLIYAQRLAYSGLLPFVEYNAWNSLLNDYIAGFYQLFIQPTIITQRIFALVLGAVTFFLVLLISKNLGKKMGMFLSAFLLTFGSFTYLYLSTVPTSEQAMTTSLVFSLAILSQTLKSNKNTFRLDIAAFVAAVFAFFIRIQALPMVFFIWLFLGYKYANKLRQFAYITATGVLFAAALSLPFVLSDYKNFLYAMTWAFRADQILVYQSGNTAVTINQLINFGIGVFREYPIFVIVLGGIFISKLFNAGQSIHTIKNSRQERFVVFSFLGALSLAATGLVHKPPYSTFIYPAVPIFSYVGGFYLAKIFSSVPRRIHSFLFGVLGLLALTNLATFPHADYMKTSLQTIHQTPYSLLSEISAYIEVKTTPKSEILAFYTPAVAELDRHIPANINRGEFSISMLSEETSRQFHLANNSMLQTYITSQKAEAIVITDISHRTFGSTQKERDDVWKAINSYYVLDRDFDNFSQIGNPRVSHLYFYLRR